MTPCLPAVGAARVTASSCYSLQDVAADTENSGRASFKMLPGKTSLDSTPGTHQTSPRQESNVRITCPSQELFHHIVHRQRENQAQASQQLVQL